MDFNDDFSGKIYLSFGKNPLDGMTFVMQKSSPKVISSSTEASSLGVYGGSNSEHPYKEAIQRSVAIEFDHILDKEDIDKGIEYGDHLAYTFPGNPATYGNSLPKTVKHCFNGTEQNIPNMTTALKSKGGDGEILFNEVIPSPAKGDPKLKAKWFPFNFAYSKEDGVFTYSLGLSATEDGDRNTEFISGTISEDELFKAFGFDKNSVDKKVFWGITGAVGEGSENTGGMNGIAVAKLPIQKIIHTEVYKKKDSKENFNAAMEEPHYSERMKYWGSNVSFQDKRGESIVTPQDYAMFYSRVKPMGKTGTTWTKWNFYWDRKVMPLDAVLGVHFSVRDAGETFGGGKVYIKKANFQNNYQGFNIFLDKDNADLQIVPKEEYRKKLEKNYMYIVEVDFDSGKLNPNVATGENTVNMGSYVKTKVVSELITQTGDSGEEKDSFQTWYALAESEILGKLTLDAVPNFNFGHFNVADIMKKQDEDRPANLKSNSVVENKETDAFDGNETGFLQITNTNNSDWQLSASLGRFYLLKEVNEANNTSEGFVNGNPSLSGTITFTNLQGEESSDNITSITSPEKDDKSPTIPILTSQKVENNKNTGISMKLNEESDKVSFKVNYKSGESIQVGTYQATVTWTLENTTKHDTF